MNESSSRRLDQDLTPQKSRREFLKQTLGTAAAAMAGSSTLFAASKRAGSTLVHDGSRVLTGSSVNPMVVQIADKRMIPVRIVQRALLKDYLSEGLRLLTGSYKMADAWHAILKPDDVVLIKFNQSAARTIGTTPAMASVLVESLIKSGWNPEQLILLEAGDSLQRTYHTRKPDYRWQGTAIHFGDSGSDRFIAALDHATAIINVPFLKTHHMATMTGCLKNLSHGLIQHPARFHSNRCNPAIGEIVASSPLRSRIKLNIVNGLRIVFDRGPEADSKAMVASGLLLMGRDPVACDAIGYGILNEIRNLRQFPPLLPAARVPAQLETAANLGVGKYDLEAIDLQKLPP